MDIQFDDCDGIFSFVLRYLVSKLVPRFERLIMRVSRLEPVGTCRKISKTCADLRVDRAALSAGVGAGLDAQLKCVDAAFLSAFYPRSGPYICRRLRLSASFQYLVHNIPTLARILFIRSARAPRGPL